MWHHLDRTIIEMGKRPRSGVNISHFGALSCRVILGSSISAIGMLASEGAMWHHLDRTIIETSKMPRSGVNISHFGAFSCRVNLGSSISAITLDMLALEGALWHHLDRTIIETSKRPRSGVNISHFGAFSCRDILGSSISAITFDMLALEGARWHHLDRTIIEISKRPRSRVNISHFRVKLFWDYQFRQLLLTCWPQKSRCGII